MIGMLAVLAGLLFLDGQMQAAVATPQHEYSKLEPANTYAQRGSFKVRGRCIATDGDYLYVSSVRALYKYDKNVRLIAKNENPFDGCAPAASYLGDIDVFGDELFVSFGNIRKGLGGDIRIVVYDANTLQSNAYSSPTLR